MNTFSKDDLIVITGGAGLVGQNLVAELAAQGYTNILVIDKHNKNMAILQTLHPTLQYVCADMSSAGAWMERLDGAQRLFLLQAQITGAEYDIFQRNTIESTRYVLESAKQYSIPFTVFVGSSVVNSVADDNYTRSKKEQEAMMVQSSMPHCIVRPTLMFGWFDPKHLGWLSRFMEKTPVFPIPGHGKYMRQPLYVLDFCRVLIWCACHAPHNGVYDIVGQEDVTYVDIIRTIKSVKKLKTIICHLPIPFFRFLMQAYGLVSKNPPFVADQLDALMAGDYFTGENMQQTFGITPTPFAVAMQETYAHPLYSRVVLER